MLRRFAPALLLLLPLALPATVQALPGDPPVSLLAPADGAKVRVDPAGIPAVIACPEYRDADFGGPPFDTVGRADDYRTLVARSPRLGSEGLLADVVATGFPQDRGDGACDVPLGNTGGGSDSRPQVEPGTYYWQAFRFCTGCADQRPESTGVRSFTVVADPSTVKLTLRAPARAYSRFAFLVRSRIAGRLGEAPVSIQRRVGQGWKTVPSSPARNATSDRIVRLKRGVHILRARVTQPSSGTVVSATRRVTVVSRRAGIPRSDGRYRDRSRSDFRATVAEGGRKLRGFSAGVTVTCPTLAANGSIDLNPQLRTVTVPPVALAPDGRFVTAGRFRGAAVHVSGRLNRGRLIATTSIDTGACAGSIERISARRR